MEKKVNKIPCNLELSSLPHTWLIDIDGTLAVHNGYKIYEEDVLLTESSEFLRKIPQQDMVILLTSRTEDYREITEDFLHKNHIRYDQIVFGLPMGERILINDRKPSGLAMAHAINVERNRGIDAKMTVNRSL